MDLKVGWVRFKIRFKQFDFIFFIARQRVKVLKRVLAIKYRTTPP